MGGELKETLVAAVTYCVCVKLELVKVVVVKREGKKKTRFSIQIEMKIDDGGKWGDGIQKEKIFFVGREFCEPRRSNTRCQ